MKDNAADQYFIAGKTDYFEKIFQNGSDFVVRDLFFHLIQFPLKGFG